MNKFNFLLISSLVLTTVFTGCKKDAKESGVAPSAPKYSVPTVYNFTNVDHSDQTLVLNQLTAIDNVTKLGTGAIVDAANLKSMFRGQSTSGNVNIESLTSSIAASILIESFFDSIAVASQSYTNSSPEAGKAGVGSYTAPGAASPSKYLMSGRGVNYQQLISKMFYGAVLFNQVALKLSEQNIGNSVDNNTVYPDKGTMMEHHWDEAYGYFGVPDSFLTKTTGTKYLGNYCNQVNKGIGSNATIMNAYLTGRAAISNKDNDAKNAQATIIVDEIEKVLAASAIHELNSLPGLSNQYRINSVMSESYAFILTLKYSPRKKITTAQIDKLLGYFGTNFYDTSLNQTKIDALIQNVSNDLASIYGFTNVSGI